MKITEIHPKDSNSTTFSYVVDVGRSPSTGSMGLSDGYNRRILSLVSTIPSLPFIKYHGVRVIKKPGILSEEIQNLVDDIYFILYPPVYSTPGEKMLHQKLDSEHARRIVSHILPQKIQAGVRADGDIIIHGKTQIESQLFYHKFDDALMYVLEENGFDSQIAESIMWIFRTIYSIQIEGFEDIFQTNNEYDKINEWKHFLACITMGTSEKYAQLQAKSVIGESSFSREEYSHLSGKIISREFAERVSVIFEIFVENYVKVLRAQ